MNDHTLIQEEIESGIRCEAWRKQIATMLKISAASLIDEVVSDPDKMLAKWMKGAEEHKNDASLADLDAMNALQEEFIDAFFYMAILKEQGNIGELQDCARFYEISKLANEE